MSTVSVACKLPNGLVLNTDIGSVTLLGPGVGPSQLDAQGRPMLDGKDRATGYVLNHGVSKDLWDAWVKRNADSDLIRNRLVVADENPNVLRARVSVLGSIRSGFEQGSRPA